MQLKEQFWIALQAIVKLLWMVLKRVYLLILAISRYVYKHRVAIMQHRVTLPVLIMLSVLWSGYKSKQYFAELEEKSYASKISAVKMDSLASNIGSHAVNIENSKTDIELITTINSWLGTPHRDGQRSKQGTDCSGFVREVYKEVHQIELSASSKEMYRNDVEVIDKEELQEGDLVFFNTFGSGVSHVGIYLSDGKFAHTSTSKGVTIDDLDSPYYMRNYYGSGRVRN